MTTDTHGNSDKTLSIEIVSADDDAIFEFAKTDKVSDVIGKAVSEFKLNPNDKYTLKFPGEKGEKLDPQQPLASYHLADGAQLVLTSHGGGV